METPSPTSSGDKPKSSQTLTSQEAEEQYNREFDQWLKEAPPGSENWSVGQKWGSKEWREWMKRRPVRRAGRQFAEGIQEGIWQGEEKDE